MKVRQLYGNAIEVNLLHPLYFTQAKNTVRPDERRNTKRFGHFRTPRKPLVPRFS